MADTGGNKVGEAYVELRARLDQLEADLKSARAKTQEFASKGGKDVEGFADKFKGLRKETSLFGQALKFIAFPLAVIGSVQQLLNLFSQSKKEAEALKEAMQGVASGFEKGLLNQGNPLGAIKTAARDAEAEANKLLDNTTKRLYSLQGVIPSFFGMLSGAGTVRDQMEAAEQEHRNALVRINGAASKYIRELEQKQTSESLSNTKKLVLERLSGEEKIKKKLEYDLEDVANKRKQVAGETARIALDAEEQAIRRASEFHISEIRRIAAEQQKALEQSRREFMQDLSDRSRATSLGSIDHLRGDVSAIAGLVNRVSIGMRN